jgi:16S rRNA (adenine1518-N6/adenine1519-N6)-dimethyltransferase
VQDLADCEWVCGAAAKDFYPVPQVDSALVKLTPHTSLENPAANPRQLETLIKLGFSSRRKMLRNNIKGAMEPESFSQILARLEIDPDCRAEDLSLYQWINLSNLVSLGEI